MAESKAGPKEALTRGPRSVAVVAAAALTALTLTGLDIGSKTWAETALASERRGERPGLCTADETGFIRTQRIRGLPIVAMEGVLEFEYTENCGAAFGLLRTASPNVRAVVFGCAAIAACLALFWMLARGQGGPYFVAAVPLVAAGALGNFIDRMRYGYVVDFIHAHYEGAFDYPTFNIADIYITIGVICWVIDAFRDGRSTATSGNNPERAHPKTAQPESGPKIELSE